MHFIVGKRQIILASLVLILGIAVFLNWKYGADNSGFVTTEQLQQTTKNYGDSQFVEGNNVTEGTDNEDVQNTEGTDVADAEAYFAEAKLTRSKTRDQAVETISSMLKDAQLTSEQKSELALSAANIAKAIETEGKVENLIKAKGYNECMVYLEDDKIDVIIKTDGLQSEDVAKLTDIIVKETNLSVENISIIEVK